MLCFFHKMLIFEIFWEGENCLYNFGVFYFYIILFNLSILNFSLFFSSFDCVDKCLT